jgi:hypothetical protein
MFVPRINVVKLHSAWGKDKSTIGTWSICLQIIKPFSQDLSIALGSPDISLFVPHVMIFGSQTFTSWTHAVKSTVRLPWEFTFRLENCAMVAFPKDGPRGRNFNFAVNASISGPFAGFLSS